MKEYKYKVNGNNYNVAVGDIEDNIVEVEVNGVAYRVELEAKKSPIKAVQSPKPAAAPRTATGEKVISKPAAPAGGGATVKSPLPGVIASIAVKVGASVKASDTVIMLEAMKMENAIHAGKDGVVKEVLVNQGDSVLEGTPLVVIE